MKRGGFTLIELLIASAVSLIVLGIIAQAIGGSGRTVNQYVTRSDLLEDTRTAGQLMADEVAKAVYIFPPGYTLALGSDYTTRRPGGGAWVTGQDDKPILAFVKAPKTPGNECSADPAVQTPTKNFDGCVRLMAYYPVLRSDVLGGATAASRPANDPGNGTVWTLFEFAQPLPYRNFDAKSSTTAIVPTDFSKSTTWLPANMLADYIKPWDGTSAGFSVAYGDCRKGEGNSISAVACHDGALSSALPYNPDYRNSVTRASFSLQGSAASGSGVVQTPSLKFPVAPRNLPLQ